MHQAEMSVSVKEVLTVLVLACRPPSGGCHLWILAAHSQEGSEAGIEITTRMPCKSLDLRKEEAVYSS